MDINIVNEIIKVANKKLDKESKMQLMDCLEEMGVEVRICTQCGKLMNEGYIIEEGEAYYCTDDCLHKNYSKEEWAEISEGEDSLNYWTEWY